MTLLAQGDICLPDLSRHSGVLRSARSSCTRRSGLVRRSVGAHSARGWHRAAALVRAGVLRGRPRDAGAVGASSGARRNRPVPLFAKSDVCRRPPGAVWLGIGFSIVVLDALWCRPCGRLSFARGVFRGTLARPNARREVDTLQSPSPSLGWVKKFPVHLYGREVTGNREQGDGRANDDHLRLPRLPLHQPERH